jgi:ring-1,2-phenylacetyl-CoA epoxidase subunit PaaC
VIKLGDGTDESHRRAQRAVDDLWRYTGELFESDAVEQRLVAQGLAVDSSAIQAEWTAHVREVLATATLTVPEQPVMQGGGRRGRHTEHLGHLLAEMQIVARSHPGAKW